MLQKLEINLAENPEKEMVHERDLGMLLPRFEGIQVYGKAKGHDIIDKAIIALIENAPIDLQDVYEEPNATVEKWCLVFVRSGDDAHGFMPMIVQDKVCLALDEANMLDLRSSAATLPRISALLGAVVTSIWSFSQGSVIKRGMRGDYVVFTAHARRVH